MSHSAVFKSYIKCVRLAAGRRTLLLQKSSCFQLLLLRHWYSQGSVATHLRCGGVFSDNIITIFPNSDSERSLKISQYLM